MFLDFTGRKTSTEVLSEPSTGTCGLRLGRVFKQTSLITPGGSRGLVGSENRGTITGNGSVINLHGSSSGRQGLTLHKFVSRLNPQGHDKGSHKV